MARRRAQQRWIGDLVNAIRAGRLTAPAGSAAEVVATHRGGDGKLLARRTASVELLNVLRPTVAVAAYIVFEALALHDHPKCREKLRQPGNETYVEWFVQEVRRFYPFFPAVSCGATSPGRATCSRADAARCSICTEPTAIHAFGRAPIRSGRSASLRRQPIPSPSCRRAAAIPAWTIAAPANALYPKLKLVGTPA